MPAVFSENQACSLQPFRMPELARNEHKRRPLNGSRQQGKTEMKKSKNSSHLVSRSEAALENALTIFFLFSMLVGAFAGIAVDRVLR